MIAEQASEFWKSGYTGIIHKFKEWAGFWALVECQRSSIPGRSVEEPEGVLCNKCFPRRADE